VTESGIALSAAYFSDVVAPLLASRLPGIRYAAARLGSGSDVLGLDDDTSRDHDWGLRLTLLVEDEDAITDVRDLLDLALPDEFLGHPTRFATTWRPTKQHQIDVSTADDFARSRLGADPHSLNTAADWLSLTGQSVLEVTAGPVFVDDVGRITDIRASLRWYPRDVWLYVLATDWARLGQELPFIGRAGSRGDDLGSRVITARLARVSMHLGFMLERRWAPYGKWLGTEFSRLPRAGSASRPLEAAHAASDWHSRERAMCDALDVLSGIQQSADLPTSEIVTEQFYGRPFRGLGPLSELLMETIEDPAVRRLPLGVGAIEQWSDSVNLLTSAALRTSFTRALEERTARFQPDR
jgi:hypothetical protein